MGRKLSEQEKIVSYELNPEISNLLLCWIIVSCISLISLSTSILALPTKNYMASVLANMLSTFIHKRLWAVLWD
jgi:hypothetical protein